MSKEKVVLAYSGGLDTTAIIPWLKETFNYDVVCCCIDCGQGEELDGLDERAKLSGASKLYIENIVDEFCDDFIVPCVKAVPGSYPLCQASQHFLMHLWNALPASAYNFPSFRLLSVSD